MIDFNKLNTGNTTNTIINPRDLFNALPHKNEKYQYPRDVQSDVWGQWFSKRDDKEIVLKMNTGSGKTVVGLIQLKCSLNEGKGPAVFAVPDNYLVAQVIKEANALGISITEDPHSIHFQRGKEILVCNIHKLVNGLSTFGVGERKINIGSIIIDDAHACLSTIESQYTINILQDSPIYSKLLKIFLPNLREQNRIKAKDLEYSMPDSIALVPFWSWEKNLEAVTDILFQQYQEIYQEQETKDSLKFSFPLLKDHLKLCRCVVSDKKIEIVPHVIPTEVIPSLEYAQRKIFMTATLVDDSILSTHFNLSKEAMSNVITPSVAGDIGDRMILVPKELNPYLSDVEIKQYYKKLSKQYNVVIIVPSKYRSRYWNDVADLILDYENIDKGVEQLNSGHVGLVILVNRYDGIDLPQNACRILVIDGLPGTHRLIDQIRENQLLGSEKTITEKIQKIEQGMGRGIRSNNDYCVVFLMGSSLIQSLYANNAIAKFSTATKAQFQLSESLCEQLENPNIQEIDEIVKHLLNRSDEWVSASKSVLASLQYEKSIPDEFSIKQRLAYNQMNIGQYQKAIQILSDAVNNLDQSEKIFLGYAKQILAEYINYKNPVEAQETLLSAIENNKHLLKPIDGISYSKVKTVDDQANNLQKYLSDNYDFNYNKYLIDLNAILDDLEFIPGTANKFEEALKKLAYLLGFNGQRPENDFGRGPDNLWSTGFNSYFIIECKNGVTNELISKKDVNQLNGSVDWFKDEFNDSFQYTPIMIHLGNQCEFSATPHENSRVITKEELTLLKNNIRSFSISIKDKFNQLSVIKDLLNQYKLLDKDFVSAYTTIIKIKK